MAKISDWIISFSRWERLIAPKIPNEVRALAAAAGAPANGWVGSLMAIESHLNFMRCWR
ncbi:Uncharacterised protein [Salmonella enterica subsp. enterica serovar Bovismorbificans]|uniref:Uncharacterized protein n=1 Tax=Salmonella enterica subsp. enterica serovar Bovismorbificans TaxID=58097 RepID=A0A655BM79_SALET|nr:Uncharacterised protein [Salmonella enterica subsp. enterica serovar Bovismorbificans]